MRPDRVLITCEALSLHHVQATQSSSAHIVIDLATLKCVLAGATSNYETDCHCSFAGDNDLAFGTCPACAGRHRPHTYAEGCKKSTNSSTAVPKPSEDRFPMERTSLDRVLIDPLLVDEEVRSGASSSSALEPPGLEPQD